VTGHSGCRLRPPFAALLSGRKTSSPEQRGNTSLLVWRERGRADQDRDGQPPGVPIVAVSRDHESPIWAAIRSVALTGSVAQIGMLSTTHPRLCCDAGQGRLLVVDVVLDVQARETYHPARACVVALSRPSRSAAAPGRGRVPVPRTPRTSAASGRSSPSSASRSALVTAQCRQTMPGSPHGQGPARTCTYRGDASRPAG
jgi:hypothetical protein